MLSTPQQREREREGGRIFWGEGKAGQQGSSDALPIASAHTPIVKLNFGLLVHIIQLDSLQMHVGSICLKVKLRKCFRLLLELQK